MGKRIITTENLEEDIKIENKYEALKTYAQKYNLK